MQVREYGNFIRINLNEDLTSFTNTIELYKPSTLLTGSNVPPIIITSSEGLVVGSSNITIGSTTFIAGQYLEYKIGKDVINEAGIWNAVATVKDDTEISFRITKRIRFSVNN